MIDRNERVRALLQEGDPAASEPGLSLEEIQAMRRTVLTAVPEARRVWFAPALVTAAALILAAVIAFSLWRPGTVETASRPSPPLPPSPTSPAPSLGEGGIVASERVVVPLSRGGERGGGRGVRGEGPRPAPPAPEPRDPEPVVAEGPQQIQFSTPGGTRVIWMLNPATE